MSVQFRSSGWRLLVPALCVGIGADLAISYVAINWLWPDDSNWLLILGIPVGIYIVDAAYGVYRALKRWIWFVLVERDERVKGMVSAMLDEDWPEPNLEHASAAEYLNAVPNVEGVNMRAVFSAGVVRGAFASSDLLGRLFGDIVAERALSDYRLEIRKAERRRKDAGNKAKS